MLARLDTLIVAKESLRERAQEYWNGRTRLLLTTNSYLGTNRTLAVWLEEPTNPQALSAVEGVADVHIVLLPLTAPLVWLFQSV